jgi:hypothetical protein
MFFVIRLPLAEIHFLLSLLGFFKNIKNVLQSSAHTCEYFQSAHISTGPIRSSVEVEGTKQ